MTTDTVLSLPEAEALVERTKAAITALPVEGTPRELDAHYRADRKRLDLAQEGLRDSLRLLSVRTETDEIHHARRYSTLIVDTAALYGQTP